MTLSLAGVLLSLIVTFIVTFQGPPPRPAPTRLDDLAALVRHEASLPRSTRQVNSEQTANLPQPRRGESFNAQMAGELARHAGLEADDVRVWYQAEGPQHESPHAPGPPAPPNGQELRGSFTIAVRHMMPAGTGWQVYRSMPEPWLTAWHWSTFQWLASVCVVLGLLSWMLARHIAAPLEKLARSAAMIRIGMEPAPVHAPRMPELAHIADALNAMQARLANQLGERTEALAAIAHDLGTPLSRLAFHVDRLPEGVRVAAEAEIAEMRTMISSVIEFARSQSRPLERKPVELVSLVARITPKSVPYDGPEDVWLVADEIALSRLLSNLIENAMRYGSAPRIGWQVEDDWIVLAVTNDGDILDSQELDSLFKPFVRGEPSRSRKTGGSGLGLAIVRSIAEQHGGTATLQARAEGGAEAIIRLPILQR